MSTSTTVLDGVNLDRLEPCESVKHTWWLWNPSKLFPRTFDLKPLIEKLLGLVGKEDAWRIRQPGSKLMYYPPERDTSPHFSSQIGGHRFQLEATLVERHPPNNTSYWHRPNSDDLELVLRFRHLGANYLPFICRYRVSLADPEVGESSLHLTKERFWPHRTSDPSDSDLCCIPWKKCEPFLRRKESSFNLLWLIPMKYYETPELGIHIEVDLFK